MSISKMLTMPIRACNILVVVSLTCQINCWCHCDFNVFVFSSLFFQRYSPIVSLLNPIVLHTEHQY